MLAKVPNTGPFHQDTVTCLFRNIFRILRNIFRCFRNIFQRFRNIFGCFRKVGVSFIWGPIPMLSIVNRVFQQFLATLDRRLHFGMSPGEVFRQGSRRHHEHHWWSMWCDNPHPFLPGKFASLLTK